MGILRVTPRLLRVTVSARAGRVTVGYCGLLESWVTLGYCGSGRVTVGDRNTGPGTLGTSRHVDGAQTTVHSIQEGQYTNTDRANCRARANLPPEGKSQGRIKTHLRVTARAADKIDKESRGRGLRRPSDQLWSQQATEGILSQRDALA
jgi:hypothetical protein